MDLVCGLSPSSPGPAHTSIVPESREYRNNVACFRSCGARRISARSPSVLPLIPVLSSHWLYLHVGFVLIGEGFFSVASIAAAIRLLKYGKGNAEHADAALRLDLLIHRFVQIGFPLFTLGGLLFGRFGQSMHGEDSGGGPPSKLSC